MANYASFIALVAALTWWADGAQIPSRRNLIAALVLLPLFAWVVWLRRDWAPAEYQRRRQER